MEKDSTESLGREAALDRASEERRENATHAATQLLADTARAGDHQIVEGQQRDRVVAGQRKVNMLWEYTQSTIAISVVIGNLIVGVGVGLGIVPGPHEVPPMLTNALFLVVGFYFSRTNHAAIGGIGAKPMDEYRGR